MDKKIMEQKWGAARTPEELPALSPTFARAVFSEPDAASTEALPKLGNTEPRLLVLT